jgi:hypothetical protein
MKKIKIIYWIFTGLLATLMLISAVPEILQLPSETAMISTQLRYPAYIVPFLGVAKLLAVIALLIPGFPKIKEWAYAGLTFDLCGALYSCLATGNSIVKCLPFLIFLGLVAGSYIFYHKKLNHG